MLKDVTAKRLQGPIENCQMWFGAWHVSTTQGHDVWCAGPEVKPASNDPAWDREKCQGGIDLIGSGQPKRVPARQKDVASHLDNARLIRAFPQSTNSHHGNGVFDDGSVKRSYSSGKDYHLMTSLGKAARDLLASGGRSSANRRVLVVDEEEIRHSRYADDRLQMTDDKCEALAAR